jgi:hypothetical protein
VWEIFRIQVEKTGMFLLPVLATTTGMQGTCPNLPYNQSGKACGQLTYHPQGNPSFSLCEQACCTATDCTVWQWRPGDAASNGGCWMSPFRTGPNEGCPPHQSPGLWVGGSHVAHPLSPPPSPPPPSTWTPRWTNQGSYDAVVCEGTPFWWPKNKKMHGARFQRF